MRTVIDSHLHLPSLNDISKVVERSKMACVDALVSMGGDVESSKVSIKLSNEHRGYVYACIGVHPSEVLNVNADEACRFVSENAGTVSGIGEIGLDYSYASAKSSDVKDKQRFLYNELLSVAAENRLPVSVHSRSAYREALDTLRRHDPSGAVFHWFDGPLDVLRDLLDYGYYVSATPATEYSKGLRAVLREAPLERILVETDSPLFLRDRRRLSEPSDIMISVKALAELKCLPVEEVSRVSTLNTETLFHLGP
jgi:TatD DNase family protein